MAPGSCTCRSSLVKLPSNLTEYDILTGAKDLIKKYNIRSNLASTKAFTPPKVLILLLVFLPIEDFFTKFMKVFMEITQAKAWNQE